MPIEITVPVLPESVADAQLLDWKKSAGDSVARDEILVEVETDKVVLEVAAPDNGVLSEICHKAGATVTAGEVLARMEAGAAPKTEKAEKKSPAEKSAPKTAAKTPPQKSPQKSNGEEGPPLGPAVRRLVEEHGINLADISGSGRGGRITKEDVLAFIGKQVEPDGGAPPASLPAKTPQPVLGGSREENREPMSRLRSTIAERLVQAQQGAALLTTFNQANMRAVMDLRARHRDAFEETHGTRLGIMSFFVRACADALAQFPTVNARIEGADIVKPNYIDIGIAVASKRGLVVPVLRNCETLGFAEIEEQIRNYGALARDGKISLDDLAGGTFTITNGGVFGSLLSTPIVNPPQSAILGMHAIEERPVAENGQVVIRPMMYLALSYDHRIIDGEQAVGFLVAVKNALEDPGRMLLRC
ncbi:MAG: dihydrolipoyltranssuccinylase [Arenicellales bacterium IbO2]|nr:2-oxoglutarate dehydrogenase complex dihydrolipoyllysine-residue succinyltransferase [Gammaproteobacteria bacterium]MDA7996216.1 2-oxoglutarate dehydrogenase complex dihydrolipoyllysine-residue succinyltransferase [Gammaproteobacteria bacterium]CAJ2376945.1 MAG: dihydrolipoyltranssuccinylase [Arenicellales bacterium IbO2]